MAIVLRHVLRVTVLLWALLLMSVATAQSDPAAIQVGVADDSDSARAAGLARAMDAMLVRLTGDPDVVETEAAAALRADVEEYVSGFSYRSPSPSLSSERPERPLQLLARFSRPAVRRALARAEIAVWPASGPSVLVWLGAERNGERFIAGNDRGRRLIESLRAAAQPLGITLMTPLLDLEDRRSVGYADIAGGFETPVREASARYGADAAVIGRLQGDGRGGQQTRWTLLGDDDAPVERWTTSGDTASAVLTAGVRALVPRLRARYAYVPDPDSQRRLSVWVGGIGSLATHQAVADRLGEQVGVTRVMPVAVVGDRVRWELAINVGPQRIRRALTAERRLRPDGDGYRWRQ